MSASRMPRLVLLDTKFVARQAALSARRTPTAGLNCAGDLLYGTTFSRSRLERQYGATEWIKLTVTCPERVRCADVGGANFSLPLNTLSCSAIFCSIAPRPLCCILRPPAPAADLCGIKLPHFVYPTEHRCEFGLRLRQLLAQFKQFFVCVLDPAVLIPPGNS